MKFIDEGHSYVTDHGEKYLSVTSLIKQYEPKKDWDKIASNYAKKHKRDVEEVKAAWKEEGRKGIERGTAYHTKMESEYVDRGSGQIDGVEYPVIPSPLIDGIKLAIPLKLSDGIYPEIIVYSDKYKISGQADLVEVANGLINIKDYKTTKKIDTESFKNWKGQYEKLLHPLGHLMNCKHVTYSLQINIYMYLLRKHNPKLKIGNMEIHQIKEDGAINYIAVPDLQKESRTILEHYYENLKYSF
jgi:hypothetical protein